MKRREEAHEHQGGVHGTAMVDRMLKIISTLYRASLQPSQCLSRFADPLHRRRSMLYKLLTVFLALLLVAENVYILVHRHPANRFKVVAEYGSVVAFDTATGQLCKTLRTGPPVASQRPTAPSNASSGLPSGDPITDEIRTLTAKEQVEQDATLDFVRKVPACPDIR